MKFKFTRTLSQQQKILFLFVVVPMFFMCASIIGSAIVNVLLSMGIIENEYYTVVGVLNLIVDLGELVVVCLIFKEDLIIQFKSFIKYFKTHIIKALFTGPGMILLMSLVGGVTSMLLGGSDTSANQSLIESVVDSKPLLMFFTTVFLAPVLEEIIFRGMMFAWIYEKFPRFAHIISSFLFAFAHVALGMLSGNVGEFIQIVPYFLMALVLSKLYEKSNNIYVPIIAHTVNNFIAVVATMM